MTKVLILKPSSLGDVVQAIPVLRLIKLHLRESRIYWWIESGLAGLLEGDPDLAGLIPFDRHGWASPGNWGRLVQSVAWMRRQQFDWVIDLQCLVRSGAFAWLANGRLLAGLDEPREGARGFYDLTARRASFHTHAVDWYLSLLPLLGVPTNRAFEWLPTRPQAKASLEGKFQKQDFRWIVLQPGARWSNKRWPAESFAELVRRLAQARHLADVRFAILGGREDVPLGDLISRAAPSKTLDLTGKLSLAEMVECIRHASAMVTNDTGPMHVAAALEKPVVALFGPTEPRRTGPYGQLQNVLQSKLACVPCMKSHCANPKDRQCLVEIAVEDTARKVTNILSQ